MRRAGLGLPRATAALNTLRQVGGSLGTALLAVALQHESVARVERPSAAKPDHGGPRVPRSSAA